jgi:hypothetical protein
LTRESYPDDPTGADGYESCADAGVNVGKVRCDVTKGRPGVGEPGTVKDDDFVVGS